MLCVTILDPNNIAEPYCAYSYLEFTPTIPSADTMLVVASAIFAIAITQWTCDQVALGAHLASAAYTTDESLLRLELANIDSELVLLELVMQSSVTRALPQYLFVERSHDLYLVFRGTDSIADMLRDLDARPNQGFHSGFFKAAADPELQEKLVKHTSASLPNRLIITGHSLGGATALAMVLAGFIPALPTTVITFGAPAVCWRTCPAVRKDVQIISMIWGADIVPRIMGNKDLELLPGEDQNTGRSLYSFASFSKASAELMSSYKHPESTLLKGYCGHVMDVPDSDRSVTLSLQDVAVEATFKMDPMAPWSDHKMTNYVNSLVTKCSESKEEQAQLLSQYQLRQLRVALLKLVLSVSVEVFLPSTSTSEAEQMEPPLLERRATTAKMVYETVAGANDLLNLTTSLVSLFSATDATRLNSEWSTSEQKLWVSNLIKLQFSFNTMDSLHYVSKVAAATETFIVSGLVQSVFTSNASRLALLSSIHDVSEQGAKLKEMYTLLAKSVRPLTKLTINAVVLGAASALHGGAATTSALAKIGYPLHALLSYGGYSISAMAAGPVVLAAIPTAAAVAGANSILPDSPAGSFATKAGGLASIYALRNVHQVVTANGAGYMQMTKTLAEAGGGAIATCAKGATCGGMLEGLSSVSNKAALDVTIAMTIAYGSYKVYEWLTTSTEPTLTDQELSQMVNDLVSARDNASQIASIDKKKVITAEVRGLLASHDTSDPLNIDCKALRAALDAAEQAGISEKALEDAWSKLAAAEKAQSDQASMRAKWRYFLKVSATLAVLVASFAFYYHRQASKEATTVSPPAVSAVTEAEADAEAEAAAGDVVEEQGELFIATKPED